LLSKISASSPKGEGPNRSLAGDPTVQKWDEASIGLVMSIATLAGLLAQTPAGALIDVTRAKRAIVIAAALLVTCASLSLPWLSTFWPVAISQATTHAAAAVFAPAIAAITLGAVGLKAFPGHIGRNESFNHAGNALAAAAAGIAAYIWGPVAVMSAASVSIACLRSLRAPSTTISHAVYRTNRPLVVQRGKIKIVTSRRA
jgi:MFS family permease